MKTFLGSCLGVFIGFALFLAPVAAFGATPTLDSEQWAFLTAINNFRAQNGLAPLQVSATLQAASQWMSEDMATNLYFSHTDSLGRYADVRIAAFGYTYYPWGENIAAGYSDAQSTLNQWANSSGHRANMLNASFKAIGIGRAYNPSSPYRWYWTTDFGGVIDQPIAPGNGGGGGTSPVIGSFTANPTNLTAGQPVMLSWNVTGAASLTIDNGVGSVSGSFIVVYPSQTTIYTLSATNSVGTATASVVVTVTPVPLVDLEPPSTPAIVSIAAKSTTQVDLTWSASTDNVAVTGYQILRNGSPITTVSGGTLSYSDFGVAASTTYSYTVRAFDAASNYSSPSNAAYVTTPVPAGISCPAAGSDAFTGCYYNNTTLTGNPVFVRTDSQINFDWGSSSPDPSLSNAGYSVRWQGDFTFAGGEFTFTATTSDGMKVYVDGALLLNAWQDQAPSQYSFRQTLAQGTHRLAVEYYTRNGMSSAHLSWQLNPSGGRRGQSSPLISFFSSTPGTITAGQQAMLSWTVAGATSVRLDNGIGDVTNVTAKPVSPSKTTTYVLTAANDAGSTNASITVVVNAPPPGDSVAPTAPTLISATADSAGAVNLSWSASSDNTGVTGYQILRNGTVLATVGIGTLSYADQSVTGSTSYTYAIRAFDAAGNLSPQSNSISATTPAAPASDPCGKPTSGTFAACYYDNLTLSGAPALIRSDTQINFDWTSGTPDPSITPFDFSVRWRGYFDFQAGDYVFTTLASDGIRVYVDGTLVIDKWQDQAANQYTAARTMTPGSHLVTVEYYLHTGTGAAHVTWLQDRTRR